MRAVIVALLVLACAVAVSCSDPAQAPINPTSAPADQAPAAPAKEAPAQAAPAAPAAQAPATPAPAQDNHAAHAGHGFSYAKGGSDWTGACATGKHQSPINLSHKDATKVRVGAPEGQPFAISYHYHKPAPCVNVSLVHNGHALQVDGDLGYVSSGCGARCDQAPRYLVKQFHFHAPTEHTIDSTDKRDGHFPLEMHIVHQKEGATGKNDLLVVGIMFDIQKTPGGNAFLSGIEWAQAPQHEGESHVIKSCMDLNRLHSSLGGNYFAYQGSLTTPDCDETVTWRMMEKTQGISQAQLDIIQRLFQNNKEFAAGHGNNRNIQPLNDRTLTLVQV